jgi:tetratricopeptide (TPR) repeat protein
MPAAPNDQIILSITNMYNNAFMFAEAEELMRSHNFTPAEGEEFIIAEHYMYPCLCQGRIAFKEKRYADALEFFRKAQNLPENLHAGLWNNSVLIPYKYNEALALTMLGKEDEARAILNELVALKNAGMWNMGGDFVYYSAMSVRLAGNIMRSGEIMRKAILAWEKELEGGCKYYREITRLFGCFVGNYTDIRISDLYGMLGYGRLFDNDTESAREYFERSMALSPSQKIAFELHLLK